MTTAKLSTSLDNPIWHSLNTLHGSLALGGELARRFPDDIGPLAGMAEQSPEAYRALAELFQSDQVAALFLDESPNLPQDWRVMRHESIVQMVCTEPELAFAAVRKDLPILPLGTDDIPEMLALTALTEPGPFRQRTSELGGFLGIRESGRLAAMAGERLALPGFREVSAVCTYPDFRGRGYAKALVAAVVRAIVDRGETPFLTSFEANINAIRVYESVGFTLRRKLDVVIALPPPE
jgi:predicted GNAT family acetyltransferase